MYCCSLFAKCIVEQVGAWRCCLPCLSFNAVSFLYMQFVLDMAASCTSVASSRRSLAFPTVLLCLISHLLCLDFVAARCVVSSPSPESSLWRFLFAFAEQVSSVFCMIHPTTMFLFLFCVLQWRRRRRGTSFLLAEIYCRARLRSCGNIWSESLPHCHSTSSSSCASGCGGRTDSTTGRFSSSDSISSLSSSHCPSSSGISSSGTHYSYSSSSSYCSCSLDRSSLCAQELDSRWSSNPSSFQHCPFLCSC